MGVYTPGKTKIMESTDMKKLFAALIAALFAAVTFSAVAADTAKPADPAKPAKTTKKEISKACTAEAKAKGLKGEEYKSFRNECLRAKKA
jgi:invasion protein IalB